MIRSKPLSLDKSYHGRVIGPGGAMIQDICRKSGAKIKINSNDGCAIITGDDHQIEMATRLIQEVVSTTKRSSNDQRNNDKDGSTWVRVDSVQPKDFGRVIGKDGHNIKSLQEKFNVQLRIDRHANYLMISGDYPNIQQATQEINKFLKEKNQKPSSRRNPTKEDNDWETVTFFKQELFGVIIGKKGSTLEKLRKDYDLEIDVCRDKQQVLLKGDQKNILKFKVYLHNIMLNSEKKRKDFGIKKDFIVGMPGDTEVTLKQCEDIPLRCLHIPGAMPSDKSYLNIQDLKNTLLNSFIKLRKVIDKAPTTLCEVMLHTGKMFSNEEEGIFTIDHVFRNKMGKHLVYHKLIPGDLELEKFEEVPSLRETYRYDITICAPEPLGKFRYKIFMARRDHDNKLEFITSQQAGERGCEFSELRAGPGYFISDAVKIARLDIVDPTNSYTSRLNIQYYSSNERYNQVLQHHIDILKEPFLDMIKIIDKDGADNWDVQFPKLPEGYLVSFLRKAVRTSYGFEGSKFLRTSVEDIYQNNDSVQSNCVGNKIVDVFFVDENVDQLFENPQWDPVDVVEKFENTLKFSDIVMQYLR